MSILNNTAMNHLKNLKKWKIICWIAIRFRGDRGLSWVHMTILVEFLKLNKIINYHELVICYYRIRSDDAVIIGRLIIDSSSLWNYESTIANGDQSRRLKLYKSGSKNVMNMWQSFNAVKSGKRVDANFY